MNSIMEEGGVHAYEGDTERSSSLYIRLKTLDLIRQMVEEKAMRLLLVYVQKFEIIGVRKAS